VCASSVNARIPGISRVLTGLTTTARVPRHRAWWGGRGRWWMEAVMELRARGDRALQPTLASVTPYVSARLAWTARAVATPSRWMLLESADSRCASLQSSSS
jgi:hypothetical protein